MDRSEKRFGWIEASLRLAGQFGIAEKKAYCDHFCLSNGMVSRDQDAFLRLFNERCEDRLVVKKRGRLELAPGATLPAAPKFPSPSVTRWLEEALGERFEAVPPIRRMDPRHDVLQAVLRGFKERQSLWFDYCPHRGEKEVRIISPHRIVLIAGRLHLRGWDHGRNAPKDFILARVLAAGVPESSPAFVGPENDRDWAENVTIEITLRNDKDLSALRADYGFDEFGVAIRRLRRVHMRYLLDEGAQDIDPAFQSSVIVHERTAGA